MGTFTNSTHRQLSPLVRMPPSRTPAAPPAPATAPQMPSARLRSEPSAKVVVMIASAAGETIAAPSPWIARALDQPDRGLREPAPERGEREEHEADHEHAPAPEPVGEPPAQQQEAAEGERVSVDDPREVRPREVQVGPDRRQRDVHDRGVDDDHELRHRKQEERELLRPRRLKARFPPAAPGCHAAPGALWLHVRSYVEGVHCGPLSHQLTPLPRGADDRPADASGRVYSPRR